MDPNNQQGSQPTPISSGNAADTQNYLNQISAQPGRKKFLDKKMLIVAGGGLLVLIIVIVIIASSSGGGGNVKQDIAKAQAQYANAMDIIDYGNKNLGSSSLSRVTATAALVVGTQSSKFTSLNGKTKLSKEQKAAVGDTKQATTDLNATKAAGRLDGSFKTELGARIDEVLETLEDIRTSKATKTNRDMAKSYISQLNEIKLRLAET
ncbi:MAG: hypothetical protein LBK50_03980 [Candidatus Nomurabacteria bacterium]|jgi:hypothetical protein|nr:hypothetical protein [Candidatus Nomurabacteria bacterium]